MRICQITQGNSLATDVKNKRGAAGSSMAARGAEDHVLHGNWFESWLPSGYVKIAIENCHRNSGIVN